MPCRPKLCQRLAAQLVHSPPAPSGSNHIWISDELLSEAFNRFVRVSHTTRRYGSNVPGPLEARRRASKRRMGCAVASASMGPPGGDFGALFGAGVSGNSMESGWTWKAPSMQLGPSTPAKQPPNSWSWSSKPPKQPPEWEQLLELPRTGEQLVEASQIAFDDLLEGFEKRNTLQDLVNGCEEPNTLGDSDVATLKDFLTSTADEPAARNVSRFVQWLEGRSVSASAWEEITALMSEKIQLASIDDQELIEVIRDLPLRVSWQQDEESFRRLRGMLAALSASLDTRNTSGQKQHQAIFKSMCETTQSAQACSGLVDQLIKTIECTDHARISAENISTTMLAIWKHSGRDASQTSLWQQLVSALDRIPSKHVPDVLALSTRLIIKGKNFVPDKTRKWLQCLTANHVFGNSVIHMDGIYTELATRFRPSQMAAHFAQTHIKEADIIRVLLDVWLPNTDLEQLRNHYPKNRNAASGFKEQTTLQYGLREFSAEDLPLVADEFERLEAAATHNNMFTTFLQAFARTNVLYEPIVHEVLKICEAKYQPLQLTRVFDRMLNNPELVIPTQTAVSLIEHLMATGNTYHAFLTFQECSSVAITDVPKLPIAFLEDGNVRADLFEVLLRQPDVVAREWREEDKLNVTPEHIDTVHLIAHDVANTEKLRPGQAFRNVWAIYRWLQDRGAPLSPLISRAMVQAGIMRPLKLLTWIPDERLDYVVSIVEKVEGAEVRDEVEQLAHHMRSVIHDEVLAKRRTVEHNNWTNETTALVKKTHFRAKRWTKQKPFPTNRGDSFWVPTKEPGNLLDGAFQPDTSHVSPSRKPKNLTSHLCYAKRQRYWRKQRGWD